MPEFVTLKGGLVVSREALEFALDLEARGFTLQATMAGVLKLQSPDQTVRDTLTQIDRERIRRLKGPLLAVVGYGVDHNSVSRPKTSNATERDNARHLDFIGENEQ